MAQKPRMFYKIKKSRRHQFKIQFEQEAARRIEAMLAESQRISHLGSWDWDLTTDQIQFSDEMFRLVGMIPGESEVNHEAFLKFLNPDMGEEVLREFQQEENYRDSGVEHQIVLSNGETKTARTRVKIYRDENGIPLRLLGSTQDITSQKQLENSIKESEWRSRLISELTTDYIFVLDVTANGSFKVRWISENMFRLTGWTTEDLADPAGWGDLFHPGDRDVFFDFISRILSASYMGSIECRTFHKDGYVRWVRIFARPEINAENKIIAIVGAVKDISESKKAEKALLESEQKYRFLVENMTDIIWQTSPDLKFTYISHMGQSEEDYQLEEILGKSILDFMTPESRIEVMKLVDIRRESFRQGDRLDNLVFEAEFILKTGKVFLAEVNSNPVYDVLGNLTHFQGVTRDITWRKQMEENLRESEAGKRALVEAIPDLIFVQNREGVYVDYHATNPRLLIAPSEFFLGRTTRDVLPPELEAEFQPKFDLAFRTGEIQTHEYFLDTMAGKRCFESRMIAYDDDMLLSIVRDITERKQAEQKLLAMEEFQRVLLNTTKSTSILLLDRTGIILIVNEFGARVIGKRPEELLGLSIFDVIPRDNADAIQVLDARKEHFEGVVRTASAVTFEDFRGGIWFENTLYPILNEAGNVEQVAVYARDVSEQKKAEERLRRSEQWYRALSDAAHDMIFVVDHDDNIVYVNYYVLEQFGVQLPALLGKPRSSLFGVTDSEMMRKHLEQVFDSGEPVYSETEAGFPHGRLYLSTWLVPLKDSEGMVENVLGVSHDITSLKRMEKALLEANSNLEAKVKERTRELLESRDQLRELTRQIVSTQENERHRISRELHDEAGQALVGLRFSLDSTYREMPKGYPKIRKRMKQSLTLVDQTLSRLRNLAYELRPPMLDLMGIYLSIKQLCQDFSEQTGIKVDYFGCVLDGLEDEISISLYRFVQEALTNAAKHGHATKIQVILNYHDGVIVASVRDNGQGISETWEPGLGLTGIKERFDFLSGQLEIGPSKPKGTLIQISLPWKEGVSLV